jgi:hypothetical protein
MIRRMSRVALLQRRPVLLAGAAAFGVITGHVLDALGLLPGVHESAEMRAAALAPPYTLLTVLGAGLLAVAAERMLRRQRPWLAVAVLVTGQTALLALPEALAEAAGKTGQPGAASGGELEEMAKLGVAVGLQVVVACLAVCIAAVVDRVLLRLPQPLRRLSIPDICLSAISVPAAPTGRIVGGVRGRGPPVAVVL